MPDFTEGEWKYIPEIRGIIAYDGDRRKIWGNAITTDLSNEYKTDEEIHANGRLIAAAPELYEMLKEELIPTSDYGGILSFSREAKVRKLLARIDGEETCHD